MAEGEYIDPVGFTEIEVVSHFIVEYMADELDDEQAAQLGRRLFRRAKKVAAEKTEKPPYGGGQDSVSQDRPCLLEGDAPRRDGQPHTCARHVQDEHGQEWCTTTITIDKRIFAMIDAPPAFLVPPPTVKLCD